MLALALQQEDDSALASASGTIPRAPSVHQPAPAGDEAVALALQQEERALLEQQTGTDTCAPTVAMRGQGVAFREDGIRGAGTDRRGLQDRER